MCKLCEERIAQNSGAATGAAMGYSGMASNVGPASTVDQETKRMLDFLRVAVVTPTPDMFLSAPLNDGKYGIGYVDHNGVNRAFIFDINIAEDMAQGMLQEIAATKSKMRRKALATELRGILLKLEAGVNLDMVLEEIADIAEGG